MDIREQLARAEAESLSTMIWNDLDEATGGIGWWESYDLSKADRFDLSDYLLGAVDGVASNLDLAATCLHEYRATRESDDYKLRAFARSNPDVPLWYGLQQEAAKRRKQLMSASLYGFFNAASSVLDTLAATVIGVAGLSTSLIRADLRTFEPFTPDPTYPTGVKGAAKIFSKDPAAYALQVDLVRAFRSSVIHAGPNNWHLWLNQKRNQLAHRGVRLNLEAFLPKPRSWDFDRRLIFDREPDLTTTQSFRSSVKQHPEAIYLSEDQVITMVGINESLRAAVIGTILPCKKLWEHRRAHPDLIAQPQAQWPAPKSAVDFPGYEPDSSIYKDLDTIVLNPRDATRLSASKVLDPQTGNDN